MPLVLQVVLCNEIQGLLCLLEVSMERPEDLREVHGLGGLMFRSQPVEFSAFFFVVFRTDSNFPWNLRPKMS